MTPPQVSLLRYRIKLAFVLLITTLIIVASFSSCAPRDATDPHLSRATAPAPAGQPGCTGGHGPSIPAIHRGGSHRHAAGAWGARLRRPGGSTCNSGRAARARRRPHRVRHADAEDSITSKGG
jgi:hypothetical protein